MGATPPDDVELNPFSREVFAVLAEYTAFPWPVLKTQAARAGVAPDKLTPQALGLIVERLAVGVERFTSPESGHAVRRRLLAMASRSE
ncbi:MAG: hypothetical protein AAF721_21335 [Myxococcota bacterium]